MKPTHYWYSGANGDFDLQWEYRVVDRQVYTTVGYIPYFKKYDRFVPLLERLKGHTLMRQGGESIEDFKTRIEFTVAGVFALEELGQ